MKENVSGCFFSEHSIVLISFLVTRKEINTIGLVNIVSNNE